MPPSAADHDFHPAATVTPGGSCLPASDDLFRDGGTATGTRDWLADRLVHGWEPGRERFPQGTPLGINLDNGPEPHRRRTQFLDRLVPFAQTDGVPVRFASDPPSHSKDTPIERCWGMLEHQWNGTLLDPSDPVVRFAATLPWKGLRPLVDRVTTPDAPGVKLTQEALARLETEVVRLPQLEQWVVDIVPSKRSG